MLIVALALACGPKVLMLDEVAGTGPIVIHPLPSTVRALEDSMVVLLVGQFAALALGSPTTR